MSNTLTVNQLISQMKLNDVIAAGIIHLKDMGHDVETIEFNYIQNGSMGVLEGTNLIVSIMDITKDLIIDLDPEDIGLKVAQSAVLGANVLQCH